MPTKTLTLTVQGKKHVFLSDNDYGDVVRIKNVTAQIGPFPFDCGGDVLFNYETKQFCGLTFCFYRSYREMNAWFTTQNFNTSVQYSLVDSKETLKSDHVRTFAAYNWPVDTFGHLDVLFSDSEALDIAPAQLGLGEIYWWYNRENGQLMALSIPRFDEVLENSCLTSPSPLELLPLAAP
jgi:hypothetical protein